MGRFSPCPTTIFDPATTKIGYHTVVFVANRRDAAVDKFHHRIHRASTLVGKIQAGAIDGALPLVELPNPELRKMMEEGVTNGWFRDTTRIAEWIGAINAYADFPSMRAAPLELVIAHGESHIYDLLKQVAEGGLRPAGVILSGSTKMLSDVLDTPVIKATLALVRYCLDQDIPTLGICFGFHLMAYARYGALAEYITVPSGMGVEFHQRHGMFSPVTAGARRTVYGCPRILRAQEHPVMNQVDRILALEVHSQYLWPGHPRIPATAVLAKSKRLFRPGQQAPGSRTVVQEMIEVLSCGPWAVGTQLHPELTPELLLIVTYFPEIVAMLESEGQSLDLIRKEVKDYPGGTYFAGQRVGYNWVKRVVALAYIIGLEAHGLLNQRTREILLRRLVEKDPTVGR